MDLDKWRELAIRDDVLDRMVPNDVRSFISEIERLEKENAKLRSGLEKLRTLAAGALDDLAVGES